MPDTKTIVVIGGTAHFGERICRRLIGEPNSRLVVTSRSEDKAQKLVSALQTGNAKYEIEASALDQTSPDFETRLCALNPDFVIHTAGPYQGQDYRVARACIHCSAHYIDLADWIFTTPAIVVQATTGLWLTFMLSIPLGSVWFITVVSLFVLIGICWVPVVWIQVRIRNIIANGGKISDYQKLMKTWVSLGVPAFISILILYFLMVTMLGAGTIIFI